MLAIAVLLLAGCKETLVRSDLPAPELDRVSDENIEKYILRSYIDLIGAAPTEAQIATWKEVLRQGNLSAESRLEMIDALQQNPEYRDAYARNLYVAAKAHFLENFPDDGIREFIGRGSEEDDARLRRLLDWPSGYLADTSDIFDLQESCLYNLVYDQINMGSFNFVRASFDNLLWRFPTQSEFDAGFAMVEFGRSAMLFSRQGSDKDSYLDIVLDSEEALQGIVIWQYDQLLARRPTAAETLAQVSQIRSSRQIIQLQREIMQSNEYAGF